MDPDAVREYSLEREKKEKTEKIDSQWQEVFSETKRAGRGGALQRGRVASGGELER